MLIVRRDHPLASRDSVTCADLVGLALPRPEPGNGVEPRR